MPVSWSKSDCRRACTIERSAFAGCSSLREINIPQSVSSIGELAFAHCGRLGKLNLPANTSVESHTFRGCPANAESPSGDE